MWSDSRNDPNYGHAQERQTVPHDSHRSVFKYIELVAGSITIVTALATFLEWIPSVLAAVLLPTFSTAVLAARWKKPLDWITAVAIAALVGGAVYVTVVIDGQPPNPSVKPPLSTHPTTSLFPPPATNDRLTPSDVGSETPSPSPPATRSPHAPSSEAPIISRQITLGQGQSIDIESAATEGASADGPNGASDLYLNSNASLRANNADFYQHRPSSVHSENVFKTCFALIDGSISGYSRSSFGVSYNISSEYCFLTSERRVAWLRVNSYSGVPEKAVINIQVWRNTL